MSTQSRIFLDGEGDEWYLRNREAIEVSKIQAHDVEFIFQTLKRSKFTIKNILEIGCSSATKLKLLTSDFIANGAGIDPSTLAIERARDLYPEFDLHVGLASKMPFQANKFDLIFFSFCLYLVPPEELESTLKEALRVLKPKSLIAITDFDPGIEMTQTYKHADNVKSYKRDYTQHLGRLCNSSLIAKKSFSHQGDWFVIDRKDRISTQVFFVE